MKEELFQRAIGIAANHGFVSVAMLQRALRLGYVQAFNLIDEMLLYGFVQPRSPDNCRYVCPTSIKLLVATERSACRRVLLDEADNLVHQAESLEASREPRYREICVEKRERAELLRTIAEVFDRDDRDLGELQRERFDHAVAELRDRHSTIRAQGGDHAVADSGT